MSGFNRDAPRTNSIYYGLNADTGKAVWFSLDPKEDDWTAHYLGANPQRASLPQFVPFMSWQYLTHDAPTVSLPPPLIVRLDSPPNELHLRVSSPRAAPRMYLYGDPRNPVLEASVDGAPIDADKAFQGLKAGPESLRVPHAALGTLLFQRATARHRCAYALARPSRRLPHGGGRSVLRNRVAARRHGASR